MNPLNHFGIKTQFIRGDTTSYNNNNEDGSEKGLPNIKYRFGIFSVMDGEGKIIANYRDALTANSHLQKLLGEKK